MGYFDNTQTIATEAVFDPELTTQKLLEVAKTNIDAKITTVDAAADLENQLSEEAAEFNGMLTMMNNAIHQCEAGEISKEQCTETCAPCVKALKEKCAALKLADQSVDGDDITEAEIAMLREFIVGCKDLVATKKQELQDCPITQNAENFSATEGLMSYINNLEPATEGLFSPNSADQLRKSGEARTATELYNNAKKMYKLGSKEKAVESMKKAKSLYEKCLAKARKSGGERSIERSVTAGNDTLSTFKITDTDKKAKAYKSNSYAYIVAYFEDRIDSCEAYLMKWANKAGKGDIEALKKQLKDERKAEKARIKEEKKAAKAAQESALAEAEALEGYLDTLMLDLQMDAAMESEGEPMIATEAVDIAGKIRGGFNKLKAAVKKGDKAEIEAAQAEIKEGADQLASADENADEEGKKKMSTAAKVGIGAAATAATVAGVYALGKALSNASQSNEKISGSKAAQLIIKASNAIGKGASAVKNAPGKALDFAKAHTPAGKKAAANAAGEARAKANTYQFAKPEVEFKGKDYGKSEADKKTARDAAVQNMANSRTGPGTSTYEANRQKFIDNGGTAAQFDAAVKAAAGNKSSSAAPKGPTVASVTKPTGDRNSANDLIHQLKNTGFQKGDLAKRKALGKRIIAAGGSLKNVDVLGLAGCQTAGVDPQASYTPAGESYIGSVLGMLAMENDHEDIPLSEVEEDPGKGFDAEAQGEDMIEEAEESALDDLAIESAIALYELEDGVDAD